MAFEHALPPIQTVSQAGRPEDHTPWGARDVARGIGVVILGLFVIMLPVAALVGLLAGGDLDEDDTTANGLAIGASFVVEALLLGVAAWFSVRKYGAPWSTLGLRMPRRGSWWSPLALFFAVFVVFLTYATVVSALFGEAEGNIPEDFFDSAVLVSLLGVLTLAIAPFVEEVFFRGFLFGGLRRRWGFIGAALASGFLFGIAHFQGLDGLPLLPMIGIIGIAFAWAYQYTGSLYASVGAHFLFNLTSFAFGVSGVGG